MYALGLGLQMVASWLILTAITYIKAHGINRIITRRDLNFVLKMPAVENARSASTDVGGMVSM